jgi:polyisoprenyl-teichoic acid--peptidoglycan teichoic acid transferase
MAERRGRHSAGRKPKRRAAVASAPRGRRSAGPRTSALSQRRRTFRKRSFAGGGAVLIVVALLVAVVAVVAGTNAVVNRSGDDRPDRAGAAAPGDPTTYLVVGTDSSADGPETRWMTLISVDASGERAAIAYLPAHTAYEVPGLGLQGIGEALGSGGISLVTVSIENMLGVPIDHFIELPATDAEALFEQTGDLTVNVPEEVRVSAGADTAQVLFDAGEQVLPARFQVDLLYEVGLDSDETELGARHLAFWQSFIETHASDPQALGAALGAASGSLDSSDVSPDEQVSFFTDLVSVPSANVAITSLPVDEEVVGATDLYSIDDEGIRSFVTDTFGAAPSADDVRVQVLDGSGDPGAVQAVAERLVGQGFRIVLSGNADNLNYDDTHIVTYESTPEAQAVGERARELLGTGDLQVSVQQQGIVDLTIVVGKDFIGATEADSG